MNLELCYSEGSGGFGFVDGGTAFVDALEKRESPFGSLHITGEIDEKNDFACHTDKMPVSRTNLKRIFQLSEMFDKLTISPLDEECVLLPFFARVNALDYHVDTRYTKSADFRDLNIATKNNQSDRSKRKSRIQPSRATKKASRHET